MIKLIDREAMDAIFPVELNELDTRMQLRGEVDDITYVDYETFLYDPDEPDPAPAVFLWSPCGLAAYSLVHDGHQWVNVELPDEVWDMAVQHVDNVMSKLGE